MDLRWIEKKLVVECECVQNCTLIKLEYCKDLETAYMGLYPSRGHKSHGATITKIQAMEIVKFLNECFKEGEANE